MKSLIIFVTAIALFTILLATPVQAIDYHENILVDGKERTYNVHLPDNYQDHTKLPVVLLFHGGGGNAKGAEETYRMNATADKYGFIVVYPAGTGEFKNILLTWNAGNCCGSAKAKNVNDVKFINELIENLKKNYKIDPKKIYATGMSNGAGFSYRLACELSNKIAAIAPVGGQIMMDNCNPEKPVPILHIHGSDDNCANYSGGLCGGCFQDFFGLKKINWPCLSVEKTFSKFGKINECTGEVKTIKNNEDIICKQYQNCKNNHEVTLCTIKGGGHTWPGGQRGLKICRTKPNSLLCKKWKSIVGELNTNINANELIWEFFKKHSLP